MSPFQNIDILMPQTCEYVTVCGKRDCAVVIKDLEWGDYPGKPGWAQCNYKGLYKRRQEGESQRRRLYNGTDQSHEPGNAQEASFQSVLSLIFQDIFVLWRKTAFILEGCGKNDFILTLKWRTHFVYLPSPLQFPFLKNRTHFPTGLSWSFAFDPC